MQKAAAVLIESYSLCSFCRCFVSSFLPPFISFPARLMAPFSCCSCLFCSCNNNSMQQQLPSCVACCLSTTGILCRTGHWLTQSVSIIGWNQSAWWTAAVCWPSEAGNAATRRPSADQLIAPPPRFVRVARWRHLRRPQYFALALHLPSQSRLKFVFVGRGGRDDLHTNNPEKVQKNTCNVRQLCDVLHSVGSRKCVIIRSDVCPIFIF